MRMKNGPGKKKMTKTIISLTHQVMLHGHLLVVHLEAREMPPHLLLLAGLGLLKDLNSGLINQQRIWNL